MDIRNLMKEIQDSIIDTCKIIFKEMFKEYNKDNRTKFGVITELGSNYAMVKIDGDIYICKLKDGLNLAVNDVVIVIYPNNVSENRYVDGKLKK